MLEENLRHIMFTSLLSSFMYLIFFFSKFNFHNILDRRQTRLGIVTFLWVQMFSMFKFCKITDTFDDLDRGQSTFLWVQLFLNIFSNFSLICIIYLLACCHRLYASTFCTPFLSSPSSYSAKSQTPLMTLIEDSPLFFGFSYFSTFLANSS